MVKEGRKNHLILLVGTNPLPNFVVAKHLLSNDASSISHIWFVYSEAGRNQNTTKPLMDELIKVLSNHIGKNSVIFKGIPIKDIGDSRSINERMKSCFIDNSSFITGDSIHLNYTGGTKVMSVHVYNLLKEESKIGEKVFSYLDARTFQLIYDDNSDCRSQDLRDTVGLSLEDLIKLHNYKKDGENTDKISEEDKNNADKVFVELIEKKNMGKFNDIRNLKTEEKGWLWKKRSDDKLNTLLQKHLENDNFLIENIKKLCRINNESNKSYLDGKWFDNYVHKVIQDKMKDDIEQKTIKLPEGFTTENILGCNWKLKKNGLKKFDLNLSTVFVIGSQVCVIACTLAKSAGNCKLEGFKIIERAKQVGGEEAKAVLVTCLQSNNRDKLEDDLINETESADRILVLGEDDLKSKDLWTKIKNHVWSNNDSDYSIDDLEYVDVMKNNIQKHFLKQCTNVKEYFYPKNKEKDNRDFELDVIFMNGYQVCGISCTINSDKKICLMKGYEVIHRVNQIGGEEAKAVLITCLSDDDVEKLNEELQVDTGGKNKLIILGLTDLNDKIWERVREHVWEE